MPVNLPIDMDEDSSLEVKKLSGLEVFSCKICPDK
jgi:hypothetical protein